MRIVNYSKGEGSRLGFLLDSGVIDLDSCLDRSHAQMIKKVTDLVDPHVYTLVKKAYGVATSGSNDVKRLDIGSVRILPPVENPTNVFWIDGNFPVHNLWEDKKLPLPKDFGPWLPVMFLRPSSSIIGHEGTVHIPRFVKKVWASAEVGLVAGKRAKGISLDQAGPSILGYTVALDMASDVPNIDGLRIDQAGDDSWFSLFGKWLDDLSPIGPCFVPKEHIDVYNLRVTLRVNGEKMQDFSTRDHFFSMEKIVYTAANLMTINPGDIFATGSGARKPFSLKDGDTVEAEVEGIGALRVRIDMSAGRV